MNHVDDSDTMTPADEASWLELVRLAPFKKAWSEEDGWTWTSPHASLIEGECDGVCVEVVPSCTTSSEWVARVVGETCSFLGSTSLSAIEHKGMDCEMVTLAQSKNGSFVHPTHPEVQVYFCSQSQHEMVRGYPLRDCESWTPFKRITTHTTTLG